MNSKIPVTILTGFLGSGKTTLLNRILSESHGMRIAVIENEFGEIGIDQDIVINADEEVFEMNNGCICCTVRGDLIRILNNLSRRRDKFDRIVLETTGLADPGPVAQTFFVDDDIREEFALEGIVTLVDAKHVDQHFQDSEEVMAQIAFADLIVLNKCDLIDEEQQKQLTDRITGVNRMAKILPAKMADVPIPTVLDIGGFDLDRALGINQAFLEPEYPFEWAGNYSVPDNSYTLSLATGPDPDISLVVLPLTDQDPAALPELAEKVVRLWAELPREVTDTKPIAPGTTHWNAALPDAREIQIDTSQCSSIALFTQHTPEEFAMKFSDQSGQEIEADEEHYFNAGHTHDDTVSSVALEFTGDFDPEKLNSWFSMLLQTEGPNIFRMKGIMSIKNNDKRMVFQGVHMLFDAQAGEPWGEGDRHSRLVFIGRDLNRDFLEGGLALCQA